jgi:antitoxin component YwqK of YwqJK toxin-antitoxin module
LLEYHENGALKAEIPYDEGKRHGVAKFYHENGILMCKIYYENGEETGKAKFYDSNGYLTASVNLDKNRLRQGRRAERSKERSAPAIIPDDSK